MTHLHRFSLAALLAVLLALPVPLLADTKEPTPAKTADDEAKVKKITLAEFEEMRAREAKDVVVLDVRTSKEFDAGHVPGAVHIDWHARNFNEQVEKLDNSKKYLVYCLAGVRSAAAANRMSTLGFARLYNFAGGWDAYQKAGKTIEK